MCSGEYDLGQKGYTGGRSNGCQKTSRICSSPEAFATNYSSLSPQRGSTSDVKKGISSKEVFHSFLLLLKGWFVVVGVVVVGVVAS